MTIQDYKERKKKTIMYRCMVTLVFFVYMALYLKSFSFIVCVLYFMMIVTDLKPDKPIAFVGSTYQPSDSEDTVKESVEVIRVDKVKKCLLVKQQIDQTYVEIPFEDFKKRKYTLYR